MEKKQATKYAVSQMGNWLVKEGGGWTLKLAEAKLFDSRDAALGKALSMDRRDLQVIPVQL